MTICRCFLVKCKTTRALTYSRFLWDLQRQIKPTGTLTDGQSCIQNTTEELILDFRRAWNSF